MMMGEFPTRRMYCTGDFMLPEIQILEVFIKEDGRKSFSGPKLQVMILPKSISIDMCVN